MTATAYLLLAFTVLAAAGDWWAVWRERRWAHYVCKPLAMVCLIGVALAIEPEDATARGWFVAALAWSLAGDVILLSVLDKAFLAGLAAFLVAHLAYVVGLGVVGGSGVGLVVGAAIVAVPLRMVGVAIVQGARTRSLGPPVVAYVAVISTMVVAAIATGRPWAIVGAALFYASDALIGWDRFVRQQGWHALAVIMTYHLGQIGLVLSLV
ncbi:MAG: lysoplasmalogenase [Acidimicrobiales bacterium]